MRAKEQIKKFDNLNFRLLSSIVVLSQVLVAAQLGPYLIGLDVFPKRIVKKRLFL